MPVAPPLIGTYTAPPVRRGQRVKCLSRRCKCKVTSWTKAPIPWPRVQPLNRRGGCGLWVNATLRRAIRTESAQALRYWFGAAATVVWKWRKAFGVGGCATTKGSRRAIRAAARKGAEAMKAKEWSDGERDARAKLSKRLGLKPPSRWTASHGGWTKRELKLLGTDHDEAIARKIGRTRGAVTSKRTQ